MASNVTIKIDVDANTDGISRVRAQLAKLTAEAEGLDGRLKDVSDRSSKLNKNFIQLDKEVQKKDKDFQKLSGSVDKTGRSFDKMRDKGKRTEGFLAKFGKAMQGVIKFALKAFVIQTVALGAGLVGVNAAFKIGAVVVKGYKAAVSGLFQLMTAGGAVAISAFSTFLAGQKQFLAAQQASKYGGGVEGLAKASAAMRSLTSNTKLAVLGSKALQSGFAALSASTPMTAKLAQAMTAMGDFAAGAADPAKAFAAAGDFLGQLQKGGKLTSDMAKAASDVGPEFAKAVDEALKSGKTSADSFIAALTGGELSKEVAGQLDVVNSTLFGTAKRNFELIKNMFTDFGKPMVRPTAEALEKIARIVQRTFYAISGSVASFTGGGFLDRFVGAVDRFGSWTVKIFNEYLPKAEGIFSRMGSWVKNTGEAIKNWFSGFADAARPLQEGGQVLIDTFAPLVKGFFSGFGKGMQNFNDLVVENKDSLLAFGQSLLELFNQISTLFNHLREAVMKVLPTLTNVVKSLADVVGLVAKLANGLNSLGGIGSFGLLAGAGFGYKKLGDIGQSKTGVRPSGLKGRIGAGVSAAFGGMGGASGYRPPLGPPIGMANPNRPPWGPPTGPAAGGMPPPGGGPAGKPGRFAKLKGFGSGVANVGAGMAATWGITTAMQAETSGGGAVSGAIGGAGFGFMVGGPAGAAAGALIGAAAGAIVGTLNKSSKNKAQVKEAAQTYAEELTNSTKAAFETSDIATVKKNMDAFSDQYQKIHDVVEKYDMEGGGLDTAAKVLEAFQKGEITKQEADQLMKAPVTYMNELKKQRDEFTKYAAPALASYNNSLEKLSEISGVSQEEIAATAQKLGVDLSQGLDDVNAAILELTGIKIFENIGEMQGALQDALAQAVIAAFQKPIDISRAGDAVFEAGRGISELLASGITPDKATTANYLQTGYAYQMALGDTPLEAIQAMLFETSAQGAVFQKGGQFEGQFETLGPIFQAQMTEMLKNLGQSEAFGSLFANINSDLLARGAEGFDVTANLEEFNKAISSGDFGKITTEITKWMDISTSIKGGVVPQVMQPSYMNPALAGGPVGEGPRANYNPLLNGTSVEEFNRGFERAGVEVGLTSIHRANDIYIDMVTNVKAMADRGYAYAKSIMPVVPGKSTGEGDTTSSRLSSTLGKHSIFNSLIPGNRTITSSLRNTNLGSLNSDHKTGNAYDLVGQNLGSYAQMVNSNGGFAEFHGGQGDRHLHVVPGGVPVGDTMAPVGSMSPSSVSSSNQTNSYSFVIQSSPNATPEQIAAQVMQKLYREQRSAQERK